MALKMGNSNKRWWTSYGAVSSRGMWVLCGFVLAILALNGWLMMQLYKMENPDMYIGGDETVSVPATVLGAESVVLGILAFALLAFWLAMSRRRRDS